MINTVTRRVIPNFRAMVDHNPKVKRCLFGEPDHQLVKQDLHNQMQEITKCNTERWNFDFNQEKPLPGSFKWELTPITTAGITFLTRSEHNSVPKAPPTLETSQSKASRAQSPAVEPQKKPGSQIKITEYFQAKKRLLRSSSRKRMQNERTPKSSKVRKCYTKVC